MKQPVWAKWKMYLESAGPKIFWWISEKSIQHCTSSKAEELDEGELDHYLKEGSGLVFESLAPVTLENK